MNKTDDLQRMRAEYDRRRHAAGGNMRYSVFNLAYLFTIQQRQRAVLAALSRYGISSLTGQRILEVGCGSGGVLLEYQAAGAAPEYLAGVDLLFDPLVQARRKLSASTLACADGQHLPFAGASFDLVLQYTAFSSVLDSQIRARMAGEILRVLKPGGQVVWYDFWWNPTNPQTRGIRPAEIRALFPGCSARVRKITLAPPIARRLVPISWGMGLMLESVQLFNTHYLVFLQKPKSA